MTALLAMVRANFTMSLRNRAALFWNLAFPALFIVIFGVVFGRGESVHFDVGVTGAESAYRDRVVQTMSDSPTFTVTQGSQEDELRALATGSRGVVAVFADSGAADTLPAVTIYYNATQGPVSQVAVGVMRQVLTSAAGGTPPLQITEQAVTGDDVSFMDVFAPGILAMSLMNSGVISLATGFVTYREKGILRRIRVTPFPLTSFLLARVISQLLIALLQAVLPDGAGTLGIAKTLRREAPQLTVKTIDIDLSLEPHVLSTRLLDEFAADDDLIEVGLTRKGRWKLDLVPAPVSSGNLSARIDAGELPGPRIWRAGLLEGRSPYSARIGLIANSQDEAIAHVRWYADHGYRMIKIYNSMNPDWVKAIAAEAHRLGLRVNGHVPAFMSPDRAILDGYDEITHVNQLALGWVLKPGWAMLTQRLSKARILWTPPSSSMQLSVMLNMSLP